MTNALVRLAFVLTFAVSFAAAQSAPPPQLRSCGGVAHVGIKRDNSFTARWVTKTISQDPGQSPKTMEEVQIIARDSAGLLRVERRPTSSPQNSEPKVTLHTRDGAQFDVTQNELHTTITIYDCGAGKIITLQPGMKVARTMDLPSRQTSPRSDHSFSYAYTSLLPPKPSAYASGEELGTKLIAGIEARGIRMTQLGVEEDEWKGKPIRIFERWVSEDLAATLIDKGLDLKKNTESTSVMVDISREEPDPALFQIPVGFKVDPTPMEMPDEFVTGKPVIAGPSH